MFFEQLPIIWVVLIIIFALIESLTMGLTSIWFAAGALVSLLLTLIGFNFYYQIGAFIVVSLILLFYTRPVATEFFKIGQIKTNFEELIGDQGIVIKKIEQFQTGQVKVKGQIWTAMEIDSHEVEVGSMVEILSVQGVKLIVKKIS